MLLDLPRLSLCVFDTRAMLQQPISFALLVEPMAWLLLLSKGVVLGGASGRRRGGRAGLQR